MIAQLDTKETYDALVQLVLFHVLGWVYQNLLTYIVHFRSQELSVDFSVFETGVQSPPYKNPWQSAWLECKFIGMTWRLVVH